MENQELKQIQSLSELPIEEKRKLREQLKQQGKPIPITLYSVEEVEDGVAEAEGAISFEGTIPKEEEHLSEEDRNQIAERLKHIRHLNEILERPISALEGCTGLSKDEAKTVIYWTTATYGLEDFDAFSPVVLFGLPETGKSSTMKLIANLLRISEDEFISTTSPAGFRDLLAERRIALIEEGDNVDEDLILKRYAKQSGQININRPGGFGKYKLEPANIYGATMLHKRYSFENLALETRCITIETKKAKPPFTEMKLTEKDREALEEVWKDAWSRLNCYDVSGRTESNWRPLIMVALALGDMDWVGYANKIQKLTREELAGDTEFEPEQLLAYVIDYFKSEPNEGFVYLYKIIERLENRYRWTLTPKALAKMLRKSLGCKVEHKREGFAIIL